jgi:hypothetical protein
MYTVGPGTWRETIIRLENEKHTVGHGVWQKTEKHGQRDTNSV